MPLIPKGAKLITDAATRLEHYVNRGPTTTLVADRALVAELRKLAPTLDRKKLLALRLELPGPVWDDAIKPILDALQP